MSWRGTGPRARRSPRLWLGARAAGQDRQHSRSRAGLDDDRDRSDTRTTHGVQGLETRRVAGLQGTVAAGRTVAARPRNPGRDRSVPPDASGDRERARAAREDDLGGGVGRRAADGRRELVGDVARGGGRQIILSDRATLRLEHGGALDAEIAPASVYERLGPRWPAIRAGGRRPRPRGAAAARRSGDAGSARRAASDPRSSMRSSLRSGARYPRRRRICRRLSPGPRHRATRAARRPVTAALAPSVVATRLDALREYYMFLDRLLAERSSRRPPTRWSSS